VTSLSLDTVTKGSLTTLYLSFNHPTQARLICFLDAVLYPVRMLNNTYGFCTVQPMNAGQFNIDVSDQVSLSKNVNPLPLSVIHRPLDLILNVSAVLAYPTSYLQISSKSCTIPKGSFCSSTGGTVGMSIVFDDNCSLICSILPIQSVKLIKFYICYETACNAPLLVSMIEVLHRVMIAGLIPYSGSVLGGTNITLYGSGFSNDASTVCIFEKTPGLEIGLGLNSTNSDIFVNTKSVQATPIANTRISCISPPFMPGNVTLHLYRRGLRISASLATFNYQPLLSRISGRITRVMLGMCM
jgi:hypothetical protein